MVTPTNTRCDCGRLPAVSLSPPLGVDDLERMKRPHSLRGDTLSIIMSPDQHDLGPSTKVRLGATHHTPLRATAPRDT